MSISTPHRATGGPPTSASLAEGLPQYVQDLVRKPRLLIDGQWLEAASGKTFEKLVGALTTSARTGGA